MPSERRFSSDIVDDMSKTHIEKLKETSPKIKMGKYVEFDAENYSFDAEKHSWHPNAEWYLARGTYDRLSTKNQMKMIEASKTHNVSMDGLRETSGVIIETGKLSIGSEEK